MAIEIQTAEDAADFKLYEAARDKPRLNMANGVYPNCLIAISSYADLVARLQDDLAPYAEFHSTTTTKVAPYIATIQAAMTTIIETMRAIEASAPGTFGIEVGADD